MSTVVSMLGCDDIDLPDCLLSLGKTTLFNVVLLRIPVAAKVLFTKLSMLKYTFEIKVEIIKTMSEASIFAFGFEPLGFEFVWEP